MAETIEVEVTGKSKYEIAHLIATNIMRAERGGAWLTNDCRKPYLRAVYEALEVLSRNDDPTK